MRWVWILILLSTAGCAAVSRTDDEPATTVPTTATNTPQTEGQTAVSRSAVVDLSQLTPPPTQDTTPREMPRPGNPRQGLVPPELTRLLDQVINHVATKAGVEPAAVQLEAVAAVTWPNAALGCPAPGQADTTALLEGFRLTLSAGGETFTYHTDAGSRFVLCVNGRPAE